MKGLGPRFSCWEWQVEKIVELKHQAVLLKAPPEKLPCKEIAACASAG